MFYVYCITVFFHWLFLWSIYYWFSAVSHCYFRFPRLSVQFGLWRAHTKCIVKSHMVRHGEPPLWPSFAIVKLDLNDLLFDPLKKQSQTFETNTSFSDLVHVKFREYFWSEMVIYIIIHITIEPYRKDLLLQSIL